MFPDFIKHYSAIRAILRDVFLYGCFSKSDLGNKNKSSSRKVSYEMRRIRQYIESDFIKVDKNGKNKLLNLSYDSISNTKNFLVNTYLSKSFTKSDVKIFYYILLRLSYHKEPMTFSEIEEALNSEGLINYEEISSKTIERKLNEMCNSMEIVSFQKRGRVKEYFIAEDILADCTDEEVQKLFYVSDLYKNIIYPNISGYYFYDTLKDYMEFERNIDCREIDPFQYEYLHFQAVIEEELILKIMRAIKSSSEVILKNNTKSRRYREKHDNEILKPIKLRYDIECGRFYVIGFCNEKCISVRLDRKEDIKITSNKFDYDKYIKLYEKSMKRSFSSVPNNNDVYEDLKLELKINYADEKYLLDKIKGELGECSVECIDENKYIIDKQVNDAWEMIPWIRKYGGNIKVIEPARVKKKLSEDWEAMLKNYGVIS